MKRHAKGTRFVFRGIFAACVLLAAAVWAAPRLTVKEQEKDFGEVWEGTKLVYTFKVANTGDEDLVIHKVKTS